MICTKVRGINLLDLNQPLLGPGVVEPFTVAAHKGDTEMAEVEAAAAIYLADADRVEKLLDIISNTANWPNVPCIRAAAQNELAQIEHDLWTQMYPEQVAAEEARVKAVKEAEEARLKRIEEEKAAAKAKEPERDTWVPPRDTQAQPVERRM
jgi:hypothetical protein